MAVTFHIMELYNIHFDGDGEFDFISLKLVKDVS